MILPTSPAPLIFAPAETYALAVASGLEAGLEVGALEERQYDGGEFKLRPLQSVRERAVFVIQSLAESADAPIATRLVRLLFLLQGLRDAGATRLTAVIPYLAYARKDRRTKPRDPVYTRYVAQLLEASGCNRVVALDVHNAASLDNAFRIPAEHLTALPMMAGHFGQQLAGKIAVASPDIGGIKRAQLFRELLERRLRRDVDLIFIEKRRNGNVVSGGTIVGHAGGKSVIVLDDLCASGATLKQAARVLSAAGAASVHAAVTHTPIESGLRALLETEEITRVVVTDSTGHNPTMQLRPELAGKLQILPIGPLLGCAMLRMTRGASLAPLLEEWPPPPL